MYTVRKLSQLSVYYAQISILCQKSVYYIPIHDSAVSKLLCMSVNFNMVALVADLLVSCSREAESRLCLCMTHAQMRTDTTTSNTTTISRTNQYRPSQERKLEYVREERLV